MVSLLALSLPNGSNHYVGTFFKQQLRDNTQGRLTISDFEKAWKIQRIELGLATEIGRHEVDIKDRYEGVSDGELILQLETLTTKYKEKLSRQQVM